MRQYGLSIIMLAGLFALGGCQGHGPDHRNNSNANSPAGKVGQAAHKVSVEADKAAAEAKREISQAAHDARAGWRKDAQKDPDKR